MLVVLFLIIFLIIANRGWLSEFVKTFLGNRNKVSDLTDKELLDMLRTKTGMKVNKIKLSTMKRPWAMMGGFPPIPYMIVSQDAMKMLNKDELQWLLLHEAGHYVLLHTPKSILILFVFASAGISVILIIPNLFLAIILGLILGIIHIQITRRQEYQANYFALARMDNPKGLNNLYDKAYKRWTPKGLNKLKAWQRAFNIWNMDIYKDLEAKSQI